MSNEELIFCEEFSIRLKNLMWRDGISVRDLAKDIGVDKSMIVRWMSGKAMPSFFNVQKLSRYFKIKLDFFYVTDL